MDLYKQLGKCPYCEDGVIEVRPIIVQGKKVKLYACSNAQWHFEFDMCELSEDATCSYRIFSNQLSRWNKKSLSEKEIRTLLIDQQLKVSLYSPKSKQSYDKWVIPDQEYGLSVLWDETV